MVYVLPSPRMVFPNRERSSHLGLSSHRLAAQIMNPLDADSAVHLRKSPFRSELPSAVAAGLL
jgi:hypothetical protein